MTPENLVKVIKFLTRRKPFKPYVIVLHGNERLEVKHPEIIQIQGTVVVFQDPAGTHTVLDGESVGRILIV